MRKSILILLFSSFAGSLFSQSLADHLRVENRLAPVGVDVPSPRMSWEISSKAKDVVQTAYEIQVSRTAGFRNGDLVWGSGKVNSDVSLRVPYAGKPLSPGQAYLWRVRVWDGSGKAGAWSAPASFRMGLMSATNWKAKWIGGGYTEDSIERPAVYLRKEFKAGKKVASAVAFVTARGMYEARINGKRMGDAYLTPGWTSYATRLQYQVYDVTNLLQDGGNAIGVAIGNGWYRGYLAFENHFNLYGRETALLFQLDITYADGSKELVVSDGSWTSSTGPIRYNEIYHGETYDARKEEKGWSSPGFQHNGWVAARVLDLGYGNLIATENEPVKKQEVFRAQKVFRSPKGELLVDFGQNLVGWVVIKVRGKAGDEVTVQHAEVLDKFGNFYTDNLRAAKATDRFILAGNGEETFEPHFTWHGFRYAKVEGYPGELKPEDITAVSLYSDMETTGKFSCSNPLINQLQHNIEWGQRGNFLDVPTDCPQRDERLGWTGDAQAFSRTAAFNMNVNAFFGKWLKDVAADQNKEGAVPFVVPNVLGDGAVASTGWADVATIAPWNMYLAYGDKGILETQYPSMKAWVDYMTAKSRNDLWNTGFHFGDWLFYRPFDDNDGRSAVTDKYLLAQCFWAYSTQILANTAKVLGKLDDQAKYEALVKRIKAAYMKEYVTGSGRLVSGTQTAYTLALQFDMLPESMRADAAARLAQNIRDYDEHITTGFLGSSYLPHVLSRYGYYDLAFTLLMQEDYPSWLYPVKMGATTIWERWDGIKPDSTFQTPSMNSFNHYAYGAIGDWMYRQVAGIETDPDAPGYKKSIIAPHVGGGLTHAEASLRTPYGTLSSAWKLEGSDLVVDLTVPANTTCTLKLPSGKSGRTEAPKALGSGSYSFRVTDWK